jgi:hypothetical protein
MKFKYGDRVVINYSNCSLPGVVAGVIGNLYTVILDKEYISQDNGKFKALNTIGDLLTPEVKPKIYGGFYSEEDRIRGLSTYEVLRRNGFILYGKGPVIFYRDHKLYYHAQRPEQIGPIWLEYYGEPIY